MNVCLMKIHVYIKRCYPYFDTGTVYIYCTFYSIHMYIHIVTHVSHCGCSFSKPFMAAYFLSHCGCLLYSKPWWLIVIFLSLCG